VRIISGSYKGRRINPPASLPVRPTTDYAREGLFNVLNNLIEYTDISVLDLFAGTGNISYEFISRGAREVLAIDIERRCVDFINSTAHDLKMEGLLARRMNVLVFIRQARVSFDLVFADPPYEMADVTRLPGSILASALVRPGGWLVMEHSGTYRFDHQPGFYQFREYGKVKFTLFRKDPDSEKVQYSSS